MRQNLTALLSRHEGEQRVAAFTCYSLEQAHGVVQTAEDAQEAVCLLVASAAFQGAKAAPLLRGLETIASEAQVPVAVQLDHCTDLDEMHRALDCGATAIMADGSALPLRANIELSAAAVTLASRYDASTEAEIGQVPGDEDIAVLGNQGVPGANLTDYSDARRLLEEAGPDLLAVAVGNVHGAYQQPPQLDFDRLGRLIQLPVHVTLHGTSGLAPRDVERALQLGVRKFNVNTELRKSYFAAARRTFAEARGWNLLGALDALTTATREATAPHIDAARRAAAHAIDSKKGQHEPAL